MELRAYQREAVNAIYRYFEKNAGNPLIVMPTACHAKGTGILMYDGKIKAIENVEVGDLLLGPDSRPRHVLHLCQGSEPMYQIIPKKGEPFVVNQSHVLSLKGTNEGKPRVCQSTNKQISNITVRDYLNKSKYWKHVRKLYRAVVDFHYDRDPELDPWTLGAIIGDGCLRNGIKFTNPDIEVLDGVYDTITKLGLEIGYWRESNKCYHIALIDKTASGTRPNKLTGILRKLNLYGTTAAEKFIPFHYKTGSRSTRLEILAGLLDTDGHLNHGMNFDFISKSLQLSSDVVFVARSLGLWAKLSEAYKEAQNGVGGIYYRVCISGDLDIIPTRVKRKQAPGRRQKKNPLVTGFAIDPVGIDDFYGFELDGDHLYLTADFIVHHNSGKSFVLAAFIREVLETWPDQRIMVLTHVKELIQQNFIELTQYWPLAPAGIYSAGLNRRETQAQVLFAGIQSVHNRADELKSFDLIMVDESHLVPRNSDTMYRRFLDDMLRINDLVKIIGLTATHYRLDSGLLTEGESRIFTDVAYEVPVKRLIDEGFLSPLVTKAPTTMLDVSSVHSRGGDFIHSELQKAVDQVEINKAAVREILFYGHKRKSWLVFCTGIQHAYNVRDALREQNIIAETVTGETNAMERSYILDGFKSGAIRALTNCDILTTGFNAPRVDLLAILRPTQSTGLYVQIAGRGMRIAPGKENCLVLDFAGNIERHGPIDMVRPGGHKGNGNGKGNGEAPVRKCPQCRSVVFTGFANCPDCGYEFPPPDIRINPEASNKSIISNEKPFWVEVDSICYSRHQKPGKPDSLRVDYHRGLIVYSEWICLEHTGFAQRTAWNWWKRHGGDPTVITVSQALSVAPQLYAPTKIMVRENGKFWRIMRHQFDKNAAPQVTVEDDWPDEEYEPIAEEEAPF